MIRITAITLGLLLIAAISVANDESSDIRHRAIVYLLPKVDAANNVNVGKYFDGYTVLDVFPENTQTPSLSYEVLAEFSGNYPPPNEEFLAYFGRGVSKEQAEQVQQARLAVVINVAYPSSLVFQQLRKFSQSLHDLATQEGGLIWDSETRELFGLETWQAKRLDTWHNDIPEIESHTTIHVYNNDPGVRAITLGMVKFGLPDIVVNDLSWSSGRDMGNLINLLAQSLLEGKADLGTDTIDININKLSDTPFKERLVASLYDNAVETVSIGYREGHWEDGDPYNMLMELEFDQYEGESVRAKQDSLISALFGWKDDITYVQHNQEILAASEKARQQLPALREDFNKGLAPGEFIQVKAPFATPDDGKEWMWVEILSWQGKQIKGLLKNEPYNIPDLRAGEEVYVNEDEVFDYIRTYPDGRTIGNQTGELIMKYSN